MKKKIGYLGAGTWGIALASILSQNGHQVVVWTRDKEFAHLLQKTRKHPKLNSFVIPEGLEFTHDLKKAVQNAECLVESVTSTGIRPVFQEVQKINPIQCPVIITSKGIEPKTG